MSDIYVVGVEDGDASSRAVDFAAACGQSSGGRVHLVHVLEWSAFSFHTPEELDQRHKRREEELSRAKALLDPIVADLKAKGVEATCEARHGHAGEILCAVAEAENATQIVIGRAGTSEIANRLLGGLAITLVQAAPVPVTVVP